MPARRIGKKAMTSAQRQQRYRDLRNPNSTLSKQIRRAEREKMLATMTLKAAAALGTRLYGVLYIDPPWQDQTEERCGAGVWLNKSAENHYPTMTGDKLAEIELPAVKDSVLFLWATVETLPQALSLIEIWGFKYRSHCIWQKTGNLGLGHWFRYTHELLLVATRGKVPAPAPGTQFPSVIVAPRGAHSEKPDVFAEMIEHYYTTTQKLEMFARKPRDGWDTWGNEIQPLEANQTKDPTTQAK